MTNISIRINHCSCVPLVACRGHGGSEGLTLAPRIRQRAARSRVLQAAGTAEWERSWRGVISLTLNLPRRFQRFGLENPSGNSRDC